MYPQNSSSTGCLRESGIVSGRKPSIAGSEPSGGSHRSCVSLVCPGSRRRFEETSHGPADHFCHGYAFLRSQFFDMSGQLIGQLNLGTNHIDHSIMITEYDVMLSHS
jgi:hypothetical protein